jgi:hypothetical protein
MGTATIDWLLEQQIIEYISIEEAHNCLVAESLDHFVEKLERYKKSPLSKISLKDAYGYLHKNYFADNDEDIT